GEREGALAVAAVGGAEEREQRGILGDRHDLPVAERPPRGREVEREDADLRYELVGHARSSSGLAREDPEQGDDEIDAEERLRVLVRLAPARGGDRLV